VKCSRIDISKTSAPKGSLSLTIYYQLFARAAQGQLFTPMAIKERSLGDPPAKSQPMYM
jgi:hypothetical protein